MSLDTFIIKIIVPLHAHLFVLIYFVVSINFVVVKKIKNKNNFIKKEFN